MDLAAYRRPGHLAPAEREGPAIRIIAVSGPDAGHALPITAVAVALAERGHDVVVATGPQWRRAIEDAGLDWLELPGLQPTPRDADFGYRIWGRAAEMAPPLAALLAGLTPDGFVVDTLTMAGAFAADLLEVPWVEVAPQFLYEPASDVPPVGLGARPPRTPLGRADQARTKAHQRRSLAAGQRLRDEMRRRVGLGPGDGRRARLFATLPGLEYPRRNWPADAFVVGPLEWEPAWPDLPSPPGDAPLVVVADSTASTIDRSLAEQALRGLARSPVRVIATTAAELTTPPNAVVGRGSHSALFRRADVVICPGGHGTVVKAITAGVPVVIAPIQGDQRETARRLELAGAGVTVPWGPLLPTRLALGVRRVLRDRSFRHEAARLAAGAEGLGPGRAARIVETALAAP